MAPTLPHSRPVQHVSPAQCDSVLAGDRRCLAVQTSPLQATTVTASHWAALGTGLQTDHPPHLDQGALCPRTLRSIMTILSVPCQAVIRSPGPLRQVPSPRVRGGTPEDPRRTAFPERHWLTPSSPHPEAPALGTPQGPG